jgi:hypothetical protein
MRQHGKHLVQAEKKVMKLNNAGVKESVNQKFILMKRCHFPSGLYGGCVD